MEICKVYDRGDYYCVFEYENGGGASVLKASDEGKEVAAYLADHPEALIPEPVPPEPTPAELTARRRAEAQAYLDSTDWYVIRKMERDVDMPADVASKRLESVEILNA